VRSCEIGTVMFGRGADGTEHPARMDLVRLAVPRRTYTQSHIDYVIEVVERVAAKAGDLTGMEITYQQQRLRHFTARFRPLDTYMTAEVVRGGCHRRDVHGRPESRACASAFNRNESTSSLVRNKSM
jgi:hypothetical protein